MMQHIALIELAVCGAVWLLAAIWPGKRASDQEGSVGVAAGRWGILLNLMGFGFVLAYVRPSSFLREQPALIASMALALIAVVLALTSRHHLAKRWRVDDKYDDYSVLVQTGPYGIVRHPMYTASLLMLLAVGIAWAPPVMLFFGVSFFLMGIEFRLEGEDHTLANHFQDEFAEYQSRVRAYIPFIR